MKLPLLLLAWTLGTALGAQSLVLGAENAAGPWGGADGEGCGNDIVKAAYQAVGVTVKLKVLPYARAKEAVLAGDLAGCFAMSPAPELKGKVVLAREPLYSTVSTFVRNKDKNQMVTSIEKIGAGAVLGIVIDYEYPAMVTDLVKRGAVLVPNRSESANLEMVSLGRMDFAVLQLDELKTLKLLLTQANIKDNVVTACATPWAGSYVGFSVRHPQGGWAKEKFDQGFSRITANGTLSRILKTWKSKLKSNSLDE